MAAFTGVMRVCIALLLLAGIVRSGEEADVYSDVMRRYEAVNDEITKALSELDGSRPLPAAPERVLSLRKNAVVAIGGELRTGYSYTKNSWSDPGLDPHPVGAARTRSNIADLGITAAKLLVDVRLRERWRMYYDIDMTGFGGRHRNVKLKNPNNPNAPAGTPLTNRYEEEFVEQPLQQAYLEFMKPGTSGFGFLAGLMKLPFGLWDRPNTFFQSYLDAPDMTGSYLMGSDGWNDALLMPHASRSPDPSMALMLNYEFRDIIRFDAALFQDREQTAYFSNRSNGLRENRSDTFLPQSWQVGMSIQPLDGWELTAHFRNRHSESQGISRWVNNPSRWDFRSNNVASRNPHWDAAAGRWSDINTGSGVEFGGTKDEQSVVVGLGVAIPNTDLSVRAEYAHGWNQGFNKYISSDNVNVGLSYRLTPRLTLHTQGEWLHVQDRSWMAETAAGSGVWRRDRRDNNLYRFLLGAEYEVLTGLTIEAGWQYEYWNMTSRKAKHTNTATSFYLGTRFIF